MATKYERVAQLLSRIRNARFGEIVKFNEELIDSGLWREYTTPVGTRFEFRSCEYDYFLAAMEADATTIRLAYVHASTGAQQVRLADITGKGKPPPPDERRGFKDVAKAFASEPSGAGARIREWGSNGSTVVTERVATTARNEDGRRALAGGAHSAAKLARPSEKVWRVRWSGDKPVAEAIADKLLTDPDLARDVFKLLDADRSRRNYNENRSGARERAQARGRTPP